MNPITQDTVMTGLLLLFIQVPANVIFPGLGLYRLLAALTLSLSVLEKHYFQTKVCSKLQLSSF